MTKKVILITGSSSGFGNEVAKLLASKGHTVYAAVRKEADLSLFEGTPINPILIDVTWPQEKITEAVTTIIQKDGTIDVLVNNAGYGTLGIVGSFSVDEIKDQFETNFFGAFKMIKAVLPYMRKQKRGLIINISSIAGIHTSAFYGIYSSSKFALEALTTALRVEESINGIDVVSVNPGSYITKFWVNARFPVEPEPLNKLILSQIHEKFTRLRGNKVNVVSVIEKIINTEHPKKNYLVGISAYTLAFIGWITPAFVIDFVGKKVMASLGKKG